MLIESGSVSHVKVQGHGGLGVFWIKPARLISPLLQGIILRHCRRGGSKGGDSQKPYTYMSGIESWVPS